MQPIPYKAQLATFRGKISTPVALGFFNINGADVDQAIELRKQALYLITDVTFSTNAKEGDFQEGLSDPANPVDPGTEVLVWLKRDIKREVLNRYPFRFNRYKENWPAQIFFETTTAGDNIRIYAQGIIRQTAGMVADGISRLDLFFNFSLYEMEDRRMLELYHNDP
jgi:hypothetical protein